MTVDLGKQICAGANESKSLNKMLAKISRKLSTYSNTRLLKQDISIFILFNVVTFA